MPILHAFFLTDDFDYFLLESIHCLSASKNDEWELYFRTDGKGYYRYIYIILRSKKVCPYFII